MVLDHERLNLAEGAGKHSKPDKRRYYLTARGSATESAALLDICSELRAAGFSHWRVSATDDEPCAASVDRARPGAPAGRRAFSALLASYLLANGPRTALIGSEPR